MSNERKFPAWTWLFELEALAGRGSQFWTDRDPCEQTEPYIHRDAARAWCGLVIWLMCEVAK